MRCYALLNQHFCCDLGLAKREHIISDRYTCVKYIVYGTTKLSELKYMSGHMNKYSREENVPLASETNRFYGVKYIYVKIIKLLIYYFLTLKKLF